MVRTQALFTKFLFAWPYLLTSPNMIKVKLSARHVYIKNKAFDSLTFI